MLHTSPAGIVNVHIGGLNSPPHHLELVNDLVNQGR